MTMWLNGFVEFRNNDEWSLMFDTGALLGKDADINGPFFGVDNHSGLPPLFADRGWPADLSHSVNDQLGDREDCHYPTWVLWNELAQIDWNERGIERDERIRHYLIKPDGTEEYQTKFLDSRDFPTVRQQLETDPASEIRLGNSIFRREFMTRKESVEGSDFPLLMKLMACLAEHFGDNHVRLVVCFT